MNGPNKNTNAEQIFDERKGDHRILNAAIRLQEEEKDKKEKSASAKQTEVDLKNIEASSSQPVEGITTGDYKETVKSVKRQNRLSARDMSKSEIKKELKKRKKQNVNKSKMLAF